MATIEQNQVQTDVTLDDLYKAFGKKKKHYATRLKHSFIENHVETIEDLMALSLYDIENMEGIGCETLRLLVTKLHGLGIDYYPKSRVSDI